MMHQRGKSCVRTPAALMRADSIGLMSERCSFFEAGGLSWSASSPPDADADIDLAITTLPVGTICHACRLLARMDRVFESEFVPYPSSVGKRVNDFELHLFLGKHGEREKITDLEHFSERDARRSILSHTHNTKREALNRLTFNSSGGSDTKFVCEREVVVLAYSLIK